MAGYLVAADGEIEHNCFPKEMAELIPVAETVRMGSAFAI
jgi:hypothetical protein